VASAVAGVRLGLSRSVMAAYTGAMAGGGSKRKRRRLEKGSKKKKKGGTLTGMRSGFKNVTGAVTGTGPPSKNSWMGTAVTVLLALAAGGLLYMKFFR